MWFFLSILSSLTFGLAGFMMKASSAKKGSTDHLLWGLYLSGTIGFFIWALYTQAFEWNLSILLGGTMVGLGSAFGNLLFMKALDYGPASLTSPVTNGNILFIVGLSVLYYGEQLSLNEWIGTCLLILAMMLLPIDPNEQLRIRHHSWYFLVIAAMFLFFLRNGGLKITEEMNLPNVMILFVGYFFGFIWFSLKAKHPKHLSTTKSAKRIGLYWGIGSGLFSFAGMQMYALALEEGPASIVSPIFATNSLVVAILSIWIFRERLSIIQTLSLIIFVTGLISIRL